ncbi:50S ribosomal protein L17 [Candidatus Daviesbacteria bacterium]|nr:50S ribosomal protein L17 [Candidatus Daviesbacteria bacterium]
MRHRVYGKHLGRDKNQRAALFKSLVRSLVLHESIETTEAKAKAIKGLVDRLITQARSKDRSAENRVLAYLTQKDIFEKLTREIAPRYSKRTSGFTQMVRIGPRLGDGAMIVKLNLVLDKAEAGLPTSRASKDVVGKKSETGRKAKETKNVNK